MRPDNIALSKIQVLTNNAKLHDIDLIQSSVERFGFIERIVVNEITGHVLSGHGRADSLRTRFEQGLSPPEGITVSKKEWLVPVDYVQIPEAEEEEAALVLNRAVEKGGWNDAVLSETLQGLAMDDSLDGLGWDMQEVDRLVQNLEGERIVSEVADRKAAEEKEAVVHAPEDDPEAISSIHAFRSDVMFPGTNPWDIPDIRADRLSSLTPHLIWAKQPILDSADTLFLWGTNAFPPEAKGGVLGFFVDDGRFTTAWTEAADILNKLARFGWGAVLPRRFLIVAQLAVGDSNV